MKNIITKLKYILPATFFVFLISFFIISSIQAATLTAAYLFLSRLKVNLDGTTNPVEMILAIDTASAPSGEQLQLNSQMQKIVCGAELLEL